MLCRQRHWRNLDKSRYSSLLRDEYFNLPLLRLLHSETGEDTAQNASGSDVRYVDASDKVLKALSLLYRCSLVCAGDGHDVLFFSFL